MVAVSSVLVCRLLVFLTNESASDTPPSVLRSQMALVPLMFKDLVVVLEICPIQLSSLTILSLSFFTFPFVLLSAN